jgi:hypothetical protein
LLLIAGLSPQNTHLQTVYTEVVREFRAIHEVPEAAIARHGAIPSSHPILADLMRCLKKAKHKQWSAKKVQTALRPVRQNAEQVAVEFQAQPSCSIGISDLSSLAADLLLVEQSDASLSDDLQSVQ